jgi:hypothetical protein
MAYGFQALNDSGNVLLSDMAYAMVYRGTATYIKTYIPGRTKTELYDSQHKYFQLNEFRYDSGGLEVMFFSEVVFPYFTGVAAVNRSGTVYTLFVISQINKTPKVHVFSRSTNIGKSGWGMTLFRSDGKTAFTTTDNILRPRHIYSALCPGSGLYSDTRGGFTSTWSNTGIVSSDPLVSVSTAPLARPAIMYHTLSAATVELSSTGFQEDYECGIRYNPSTRQVQASWGDVNRSFAEDNLTRNVGGVRLGAIVIDVADYI